MNTVVTEDKIYQGGFQEIMGLLDVIGSLEEIDPMDMSSKKTPDKDSPSYQEVDSGYEQEQWRESMHK